MNAETAPLRVDLWLRYVCIVKHRAQATEACRGGHVRINGRRAKPSSLVSVGDVIEMTASHLRRFVVLTVPPRPVSKKAGRETYRDESPAPEEPRKGMAEGVPGADRERGAGRPTKRERRQTERLRSR